MRLSNTIYQKGVNYKNHKVTPEFKSMWEILQKLPKDSQLLDLGCSEGFICWMAHKAGLRDIVGIDVEPMRIRKAKKYSKGRFFCGNILYDYTELLVWANVFVASRFFHNIKSEKTRELMDRICKYDDQLFIIKYKHGLKKETGEPRTGLALKDNLVELCKEYNLTYKCHSHEVIVAGNGKWVEWIKQN